MKTRYHNPVQVKADHETFGIVTEIEDYSNDWVTLTYIVNGEICSTSFGRNRIREIDGKVVSMENNH